MSKLLTIVKGIAAPMRWSLSAAGEMLNDNTGTWKERQDTAKGAFILVAMTAALYYGAGYGIYKGSEYVYTHTRDYVLEQLAAHEHRKELQERQSVDTPVEKE